MDISKDELYKIVKETYEEKTIFVYYFLAFLLVVALISIVIGIFLLSLRIIFSSILVILFITLLTKFFERIKEESIRKLVEEYDEKRI